ncbi:MAG TPA: hypothetical protein ENJ45_03175, partial [Phaeodactylibacter sp.]|nr:hypothetical protein [Phaeodactylibacter sp.]
MTIMPSPFYYALHPDISGYLYDLSAQLALFAFLTILLWEGYRRKIPAAPWLLSMAILVTFVQWGMRLSIFDWAIWQQWWAIGQLPVTEARSSLGAVIFFFLSLWFIKKWLRFGAPLLDAMAFTFPLLILLRRWGCLMSACCYGLPTGSNWGLQYVGPSTIRQQHWLEHIAGADALSSAPVHPVPLYLMLTAVLSFYLVYRYRHSFKREGSLAMFSLALLFGFRFLVEFVRDPATNHQMGEVILGLKRVQWFFLLSSLGMICTLWLRERKEAARGEQLSVPSTRRIVGANLLLIIFVFWNRETFSTVEKAGIHVLLVLSGLSILYTLLQMRDRQRQWHLKWQGVVMVMLAVLFMSQSYPDDMSNIEEGMERRLQLNWNYANINEAYYDCINIQQGCGGKTCVFSDSLRPYGPNYQNFALMLEQKRFKTHRKKRWRPGKDSIYMDYTTFGIGLHPEIFQNKALGVTRSLYNFSIYGGYGDNDFVGFTGGLRFGNIWGTLPQNRNIKGKRNLVFLGSMRIGSPDNVYVNVQFENSPLLGASANTFEFSTTFNMSRYTKNRWAFLRIGM